MKNQAIVDEAEKILKEFKPVTYDVNTHVQAIETFEAKAVSFLPCELEKSLNGWIFLQVAKAKETEEKIDVELKELQATLANIEQSRPFEQLTVRTSALIPDSDQCKFQLDDVAKAHPRIIDTVETMLKKGKWTVPGYKEKFGDLNVM